VTKHLARIALRLSALLGALLPHLATAQDRAAPVQSAREMVAQAIRYEHAEGVARNFARAMDLYCTAARMGDAEAAHRLGWMYANGRGVERDDGVAVALFRRAAEQGDAHARRLLDLIRSDDVRLPACMAAAGQALAYRSEATGLAAAAPEPPAPEHAEITAAVASWAAAWSGKNVDVYLAAYAEDFAAPAGLSRQEWEKQRRARIAGKLWIEVKTGDLGISVDGNRARVRFLQEYRSDKLTEKSSKTLTLVKVGRKWLIQREQSGN
jgi:TPR repeat protein